MGSAGNYSTANLSSHFDRPYREKSGAIAATKSAGSNHAHWTIAATDLHRRHALAGTFVAKSRGHVAAH